MADTRNQGVIFFQSAPGTPGGVYFSGELGEPWTVSAWVKGPAGLSARVGARIQDRWGGYVAEPGASFTMTGDWQRVSMTYIADSVATSDRYVGVQVISMIGSGQSLLVAGPQVERSATMSSFQPTGPFPGAK